MKENVCISCFYYKKCNKPERNIKCMGFKENEQVLKNDNRIRELTESEKEEYNNLIKDSQQLEIEDILK